ncbi:MAG: hypothetical protein MZW92_39345 [Comamonadaceae bacterium]|nr:hypothetical protein [Comamonadaceae bacterium]
MERHPACRPGADADHGGAHRHLRRRLCGVAAGRSGRARIAHARSSGRRACWATPSPPG